jgi:hypothetical protein
MTKDEFVKCVMDRQRRAKRQKINEAKKEQQEYIDYTFDRARRYEKRCNRKSTGANTKR